MNNKEYISRSLKTLLEILDDRKIDVKNIDKDGFSEWIDNNFNKSTFSIVFNKVKVLYYLPVKLKWSELKKIFDDEENAYDLIFLVIKEKVSQNNLKLLHALNLPIQLFDIKELQFNITHHTLVPKHMLVDDEQEVKSIIERYSIKNKFQLPHILKTDPMSKYLGLKSGDVIKIVRTSPTAGEYLIYRCCL